MLLAAEFERRRIISVGGMEQYSIVKDQRSSRKLYRLEWYELSRLYDRNQLVCVYPEEYKSMTGS